MCALKRLLVIEDSAMITLKRSRLHGICSTKTDLLYFFSEVMTVKDEDILKERVKEATEASRPRYSVFVNSSYVGLERFLVVQRTVVLSKTNK